MIWRVGLIDSCGAHPRAEAASAFWSDENTVCRGAPGADDTGHGSRIATLLMECAAAPELLLAQVFRQGKPASAAAVAAAVDWCVERRANLLHLSLGLGTDRPVLRLAIDRALAAGVVVLAASPARGGTVYPAAYPGVIRGTADARCDRGQLSSLGDGRFGGHATLEPGSPAGRGGASAGAAWVSRAVLDMEPDHPASRYADALVRQATYHGAEHRAAELRQENLPAAL